MIDAVYTERNHLVAFLSTLYPSTLTKTAIEGWDACWHNCVYIETPEGQMSWHVHDDDLPLFAHLSTSPSVAWDGHTTEEKYSRLTALIAREVEKSAPFTDNDRLTLCLDFDGVIHDYKHGWQRGEIYGEVVPGFFNFAREANKRFKLVIYSSRSKTAKGRRDMQMWLAEKLLMWQMATHSGLDLNPSDFHFAHEKPAAFITLDDRALTFDGIWPDMESLLEFKPWNKRQKGTPSSAPYALTDAHVRELERAIRAEGYDIMIDPECNITLEMSDDKKALCKHPPSTPCGECHLQKGERCDICGAADATQPLHKFAAIIKQVGGGIAPIQIEADYFWISAGGALEFYTTDGTLILAFAAGSWNSCEKAKVE